LRFPLSHSSAPSLHRGCAQGADGTAHFDLDAYARDDDDGSSFDRRQTV
jgi:hypothetical protein